MLNASVLNEIDGHRATRAQSSGQLAAEPCFRILGRVEVWAGDHELELGGPRQVALLAVLLLHANRFVPRDALIDAVWPRSSAGSVNRLAMAIGRLRRAISPLDYVDSPRLRTVRSGYRLSVAQGELDADVFQDGVHAGRHALDRKDPADAAELLESVLPLWRTAPLADVYYEDFAQAQIRYLEELHLVALETRADAELQLGRHRQLIAELEQSVAEYPARERIAAQLMLALYRSGRQAEALDVYQRVRTRLAETFGLQPGHALQALHMKILRQTAELEPPDGFSRSQSSRVPEVDGSANGWRESRRTPLTGAWPSFIPTGTSSQTGFARTAMTASITAQFVQQSSSQR
jgi:SARP family transcriptional regulator, regulator of embCAB operon